MKIRSGFVSNSSSCSFCIYGCTLDSNDKTKEKIKENFFNKNKDAILEAIASDSYEGSLKNKNADEVFEAMYYNVDEFLYALHLIKNICSDDVNYVLKYLECHHGPEQYGDPYIHVGRSWPTIDDDQTGAAFKDCVSEALKILTGDNIRCSTFEEGWYNG